MPVGVSPLLVASGEGGAVAEDLAEVASAGVADHSVAEVPAARGSGRGVMYLYIDEIA